MRATNRQGFTLLMSHYLLPCACGQQISVSAAQAGESLRCSCGAMVEVPTMRGLRELERVETSQAVRGDRWGDRQRLALALLVAAFVLWGGAGYLFAKIPAALPPFDPNPPDPLTQNSTPEQTFDVYHELQRGLQATPPRVDEHAHERATLHVGIVITLVLGVGFAIAAAVVGRTR
ncbi:MAG TPA: hypothetical protein VL175_14170 [Pirellulales bacterium]|nr:hypothetical protein [Pirellulales bacterium]